MKNSIYKVKGMFCNTCENRIQNCLLNIDGIKNVKASYTKEEVSIEYDESKVSIDLIKEKIDDLGYELILNKENMQNNNIQIISILVIILAIYLILNHLGWLNIFNIFPSIETTMSYGMLFIVGLLTSVHCIAMCGGINLSQSILNSKKDGKIIKSNLSYNIGRVISYTIIRRNSWTNWFNNII